MVKKKSIQRKRRTTHRRKGRTTQRRKRRTTHRRKRRITHRRKKTKRGKMEGAPQIPVPPLKRKREMPPPKPVPLPQGWSRVKSASEVYYYENILGQRTMNRPTESTHYSRDGRRTSGDVERARGNLSREMPKAEERGLRRESELNRANYARFLKAIGSKVEVESGEKYYIGVYDRMDQQDISGDGGAIRGNEVRQLPLDTSREKIKHMAEEYNKKAGYDKSGPLYKKPTADYKGDVWYNIGLREYVNVGRPATLPMSSSPWDYK